jgi:ribosome-associated protein
MTQYSSTLLAALCARTIDSLKAEHIVALDLRRVESAPADYFIICSANSDVHARALADTAVRAADNAGLTRPRTEGRESAEWILVDFFDVVLHIFQRENREFYKLEKLWGDAPQVNLYEAEQEERSKHKAAEQQAQIEAKALKSAMKSKTIKKDPAVPSATAKVKRAVSSSEQPAAPKKRASAKVAPAKKTAPANDDTQSSATTQSTTQSTTAKPPTTTAKKPARSTKNSAASAKASKSS